jgi:hypothetical protein
MEMKISNESHRHQINARRIALSAKSFDAMLYARCSMRDICKMSEPSDGLHFFSIPYPGFINRTFLYFNRLIIDLSIHGIGMTIFSAMSKNKSGWVFETGLDPVNQF